jgi:hypothetical protein
LQECGGKRFRSGFRKRCAGAAAVGDLFTHPRPGRHNGDLAETRSFDENPSSPMRRPDRELKCTWMLYGSVVTASSLAVEPRYFGNVIRTVEAAKECYR